MLGDLLYVWRRLPIQFKAAVVWSWCLCVLTVSFALAVLLR